MKEAPCKISECPGIAGIPGTAYGYCSSHYHRLKRYGDPLHDPRLKTVTASEVELAWAAGFIDGEGSIAVTRQQVVPRPTGRTLQHSPRVTAYNTVREPLDFLQEIFGGGVQGSPARGPKFKPCFAWHVWHRAAVESARAVLPFLRVKREQALCVIEYGDGALWRKGGRREDLSVSDLEWERRERLYLRSRELNRRGPIPEDDSEEAEGAGSILLRPAIEA